jgi:hypothetical protein
MPGTSPGGEPENRAGLFAAQNHEPARLLRIGGDLRDELVRPDPDRAAKIALALDLEPQASHLGPRRRHAGELEVRLVEPDHLNLVGVRPDERHHLAGGLSVVREIRRQEDPVGAQASCPRRGDRRADTESACLVGGRCHHRPRAAARDDHGQAAQRGAAAQLDGHVERVHVEVCHASV